MAKRNPLGLDHSSFLALSQFALNKRNPNCVRKIRNNSFSYHASILIAYTEYRPSLEIDLLTNDLDPLKRKALCCVGG